MLTMNLLTMNLLTNNLPTMNLPTMNLLTMNRSQLLRRKSDMNKPTLNARIDSNALRLAVAAALAVTLAGCAVTPNPMSGNEIAARVASDKSRMYADQDPITGPVSLAEASEIGRAHV